VRRNLERRGYDPARMIGTAYPCTDTCAAQDERVLESSEERLAALRADRRRLRRELGRSQRRLVRTWVLFGAALLVVYAVLWAVLK
jgi:hypothetical protein